MANTRNRLKVDPTPVDLAKTDVRLPDGRRLTAAMVRDDARARENADPPKEQPRRKDGTFRKTRVAQVKDAVVPRRSR